MKRYRLLLPALLLGLVVFAGIAASTSQGTTDRTTGVAATGEVTLSGWASSPTETKLLKEVIRGFEKTFPSVKVNYAPISGDYPAAMLAKFAARTPADVFYVDSNVAPDWIKQRLLEPLDPYVAKSKLKTSAFFPSLLRGFKGPDGKTYGFPKDWSPLAMETNNRLLAAAGTKAPKTWDELRAAARKLQGKVPGGRPICLSPSWDRLLAFVYQNGGTFLNASKTRSTVNTTAVRRAAEWYVTLINQGLAGTPAQLGVGWCGEALGKAKAAIIFEGNWVVPFMAETFPDVRFTVNKMIRGKQEGNLAFTVSYSMARDSKNKDAAWQLIRYLVGQPGMKTWTSKGLALPSRSDVRAPAGRENFIAAAPAARPWQFAPTFTKVIDIANNELSAVIERKQSVAAMLTKVDKAANEALR
ncbi:MAG: extracellular solute-binding protein [Gaiellaceae bacterium MAG52_C11]|nr:extracellular solute-binding protein [Candidatus Gaiellasilicea maunaloa]